MSHHPPISCFAYCNITYGVLIVGEFKPKSSFLGNSICANLNGHTRVLFQKHPKAIYMITYPNIYARGIFIGESFTEVSGKSTIRCNFHNQEAHIDFKEEGFFAGERDQVYGEVICSSKRKIGLKGKWSSLLKFEEEQVFKAV